MLWGFLAVFLKVALDYEDPITLAWFRFCIAFIVLTIVLSIRNKKKLKILKNPPRVAILAAIALGGNYVTYIMGIDKTSPSNAQVFIQIGPVVLVLASIFIFKEKVTKAQLVGFLIAITGFVLFFFEQLNEIIFEDQENYKTGSFLIICSAISWACFATLQKSIAHKYDPQSLNLIHFAIPSVMLFPFVDFTVFQDTSPMVWLLIIFLGVNTILAYGALAESFQFIESNKIAVIIIINPIITITTMSVLSYFEFDFVEAEVISIYGVLGALLVISGAVLAVSRKSKNIEIEK